MRLYGKALAKQIPDATTGHQARLMFGLMASALGGAYVTLGNWDSTGLAQATGLDAGAVAAARQYLDSTNGMLTEYYDMMPESDEQLTADQLTRLRVAASTSSVAVREIDLLFGSSWLAELVDALIEACGTVSAAIANTVAKAAGSFIGGFWWAIVIGLGALWAWHKWGHKLAT
jgi:hypothetical protein